MLYALGVGEGCGGDSFVALLGKSTAEGGQIGGYNGVSGNKIKPKRQDRSSE